MPSVCVTGLMRQESRKAVPTIKGKRSKEPSAAGGEISLEEIQDLLHDDGYSANQRKAWLKEVLTDLQDRTKSSSRDRDDLIKAIKDIIAEKQNERPISDDTL